MLMELLGPRFKLGFSMKINPLHMLRGRGKVFLAKHSTIIERLEKKLYVWAQ